jgi:hypothetical protein
LFRRGEVLVHEKYVHTWSVSFSGGCYTGMYLQFVSLTELQIQGDISMEMGIIWFLIFLVTVLLQSALDVKSSHF